MVWNAAAAAAAMEDTDTWLGPTIGCMEIITMVSSIVGGGGCNNDAILVPDGEMAMMTTVSAVVVVEDGNSFVFILVDSGCQ